MTDIFVSYAREDEERARSVARALSTEGWEVFLDRDRLHTRAAWTDLIQTALHAARCVVVLWSRDSVESFWVRAEAATAYELGSYLPVRIDPGIRPPSLFEHRQALDLGPWLQHRDRDGVRRLVDEIRALVGKVAVRSLPAVADHESVTHEHLNLAHSSWRVDKDTPFGRMPYAVHAILVGDRSALDRVESVQYHLPEFPDGHQVMAGGPRERLFEMKQLANGHFVLHAHVTVRGQPAGGARVLHLSRFLNLAESGPRLDRDFIHRSQASGLGPKYSSLPRAVEMARQLLGSLSPDEVVERLVVAGTPPMMAQTAVHEAQRARRS